MTAQTDVLSPDHVEMLRAFARVITPGGAGFPTAAEADPDESVLALAIHHMHRQMDEIEATLAQAVGKAAAPYLEALEREEPQRFEQVRSLLVCRYLSCRPVWALLDYTGQRPSPAAPGEAERYLLDDILDPVRRRGPIYVPTPS